MAGVPEVDRCDECNGYLPPLALGRVCRPCLLHRGRNVMLQYEREAWDQQQPKDIALALIKGKLPHLVLGTETNFTFCGQRAATPKKRRRRVKLDNLPAEMCTDCKAAFEHLLGLCRPLWAMKEGVLKP